MNIEYLHSLLRYDPDSGHLFWLALGKGRIKKRPAGTRLSTGYIGVVIGPKRYYAHRICWALYHGRWPEEQIDHINGDKTDNRITNLREATNLQNGKNLKMSVRNTSGVTGVTFDRANNKWRATLKANGRSIYLKRWDTFEQAVEARKAAEKQYFGKWVRDR